MGRSRELAEFGAVYESGSLGYRNRIINGDMRIDQRNNGASVTPGASDVYVLDRWNCSRTQASKFSVQQNAGSVTPPAGFTYYQGITSLSAYSLLAGDYFSVLQAIEGFNCADFAWGTASAATVTLSFWVRSSLTGTFGGVIKNGAGTRSYPFVYTISAANTWEYKTITIPGDTSGTWPTNNGIGVIVNFSLGTGSTFSGTAGAWSGSNLVSATGATSVVGTNGATFYITGVQLEAGSVATPFERRPYGTELNLCKRYLPIYNSTTSNSVPIGTHSIFSATTGVAQFMFEVESRVPPTGVSVTGTIRATVPGVATWTVTPTFSEASTKMANLVLTSTGMSTGFGTLLSSSLPAQIQFTGCEL
jgi:hypothetical protein